MTVRQVLAVVAWALVVLVCSGGVWGVIRTAGTGVTTSPGIPAATSGAAPSPSTAPRPHAQRTHRAHPPAPARGRSAAPAPATPTPPASTPAAPRPTSADRPGGTGAASSSDDRPAEVRRTWQGRAGAVVAGCRGATITFDGAQPNSGWGVEVGDRGPEQVEVNFAARRDDGGEVELRARCVGGEPRFSTSGD